MTSDSKEKYEAGIFLLTLDGWTIMSRRRFVDQEAASRWMRSKAGSLLKRFPTNLVRGGILEIVDWYTLDNVLVDYEKKRKAGDPEYSLPADVPAAEAVSHTVRMTRRQGQFLAFIHYYTKLHGVPPAELDMAMYFRVSPPSVHEMIKTLERKGFIDRTPGTPRSIRLLVPRKQLPDLE